MDGLSHRQVGSLILFQSRFHSETFFKNETKMNIFKNKRYNSQRIDIINDDTPNNKETKII